MQEFGFQTSLQIWVVCHSFGIKGVGRGGVNTDDPKSSETKKAKFGMSDPRNTFFLFPLSFCSKLSVSLFEQSVEVILAVIYNHLQRTLKYDFIQFVWKTEMSASLFFSQGAEISRRLSNLPQVTEEDCKRLVTWPSFSCPESYPIPELQEHLPYETSSAGLHSAEYLIPVSFPETSETQHPSSALRQQIGCSSFEFTPCFISTRISQTGRADTWTCFPLLTRFCNAAVPRTRDRQPWTLNKFRRWIMVMASAYLIIFWITTELKVFSKAVNKLKGKSTASAWTAVWLVGDRSSQLSLSEGVP